jgi:hypothetical protein
MRVSRFVLLALGCLVVARTASGASQDEIRAAIQGKFALTERSKFTARVTKPGSVLVIQKAGINADPSTKLAMKPVVIRNGQIEIAGGGNVLGGSSGRTLKPGERVYLYDVRTGDNNVILIYGTVDSYEVSVKGSTTSQYYKGALSFQYEGGLGTVDTKQILSDIEVWLKTEGDSAAGSMNTIKLGQTADEVIAILGAPEKKIDLGAKKIFVYKDVKVTFVDNKVSDVQ